MTDRQAQFIAYMLHYLDAIPGKNNVRLLFAWEKKESRSQGVNDGNNLLNTTWKDTDSTTFNSAGVQNYRSLSRGAQLNAKTLTKSGYPGLVAAIKNNAIPEDTSRNNISELNKWGTGSLIDVLKNTAPITDTELAKIRTYILAMVPDKTDTVNPGGSTTGIVLTSLFAAGVLYLLFGK